MAIEVFISKGNNATEEQQKFINAVLEMIELTGLSARFMDEKEWSQEQPLRAIRQVIQECNGAVVIAFTRNVYEKGLEIRKNQQLVLRDVRLPTTWNHIEAAIAYSYDLPLLVVAEEGLKSEGLIEKGYDWKVFWADISAEAVKSDKFKGLLKSWKLAVENHSKGKTVPNESDRTQISVSKLIGLLSIPQQTRLGAIGILILSAIVTFSISLGANGWPPW